MSTPHKKNTTLHTVLKKHSAWLTLAFCSIVVTGLVFLITSDHFVRLAWNILENPTLLFLNILPVLLCMVFVWFLSGKTLFSVSCGGALFLFFGVVDKVKITMRQEPLLPTDLTLAKEVWTIVKTFPVGQLMLILLMVVVLLLLLVLAFRFSKNKAPTGKIRLMGLAVTLFAAYGANTFWYADKKLYDSYPVIENPYFQVNQYNSKGLIYSFFHQFNITRVTVPDGYQKATFDALEETPVASALTKQPHIIMIMGEAFSDLSENPHLDFTDFRDPMENYKSMANSENAVSGKIVVPNFGGGTSNTEYDVLTALPTRYLDNPLPSYNFIHEDFDGLPRRLALSGYETLAIHPGYQWFYNRQNVYPDLGFGKTYFLEDSFDLSTQGLGGYINEEATMDKIIDTLEEHTSSSDAPLFSFTVTIQNHGPYEKHYGDLPTSFSSDVPLTETEKDLLTQYFKGISDADIALGRLRDYAQASDEPIVVVYFGDHLPGFSNGMDFFDILDYPIDANGTPQEQLAVYQTPYLIWQNDSGKSLCDIEKNATSAALPENGIISAHYLGALVTELLEMDNLSPLYDFCNDLRKELPVTTNNIYGDNEGALTEYISSAQQEKITQITHWQYYKLFDQTVPSISKK